MSDESMRLSEVQIKALRSLAAGEKCDDKKTLTLLCTDGMVSRELFSGIYKVTRIGERALKKSKL